MTRFVKGWGFLKEERAGIRHGLRKEPDQDRWEHRYGLTCWRQRNLPARGFRPSVMLVAVAGVMTFGFWKIGKGIREQK